MAQSKQRLVGRRESIVDIADDLKLLCVNTAVSDIGRANDLCEQRIKELSMTNGTLQKAYQRILNDLNQTLDRRRHILKDYYLKVKDILQETRAISEDEVEDFRAGAEACLADLRTKRYTVLIAGETSAGKSSLINLLLNDHVMPTSIRQSTLTICEISYGPTKEAVVHFAKGGKPSRVLHGKKIRKIKEYIQNPAGDENGCERIEIKIPNPLLEGGVVIVDSPGIGDSNRVNEVTLNYLRRAYAFIYVINSPNAGGLQEDRLMRILNEWIKLYKGNDGCGITAESALFVCNKWDEVEKQANQTERDDLQRHIIGTLKKRIPELNDKSQIIKMSVARASEVQERFKVMGDDLNSLMDALQRLLPICIERKTEYFYCWISGQLCSLSDQIKGEIRNAKRNKEERLKAREQLDKKLDKLKQGTPIREIEDAISSHVKHLCKRVASFLQTNDFKRKFCTWTEKDLPEMEEGHNLAKIKEAYSRCIEQRLEYLLQSWEKREKLFAKAHADLEVRFNQSFFEFENEIRDIDRVLVGESGDAFQPFEIRPGRMFSPLDSKMKKFLVLTGALFWPVLLPVGLAAAVLSAPFLGVLAIGKHLKEHQLRTNACQALTDQSTEFLEDFINTEVVHHVRDKFSHETSRIANIKRCHQQLITKYEQRCTYLTRSEDESRNRETLENYSRLQATLKRMNENLMFDAIQNGIQVMYPSCQIDERELRYNEREKKDYLGGGTYGEVFKGKYTPRGHGRRNVAIKKMREVPDPSNVALFLKEASILKQLEHKHIVTFYGVAINVQNHRLLSLVLVFDLCTRSLKDHIFKNDRCIPWKTASAAAETFQWAKQMLDALEFIHSKNVVHRDLKLANILISKRGHIKVADLGIATLKDKITGTICGTPMYMAPEAMEGKVSTTKVDIYSFGLMMWEMWFGKRVFSELRSDEFFRRIKDENYRPQIPSGDGRFIPNLPPAQWTELMTSSWHPDPILRRTATECKDCMNKIKHQHAK